MNNKLRRRWIFFLVFSLLLVSNACDGDPTVVPGTDPALTPGSPVLTPTMTVPPSVSQGQIFLDALQVAVLESFPVEVQATLSGNLSDGCTSLAGINVQRQDNTFILVVMTNYDATIGCTQALVPFTETVPLDVTGLPAGTYTVMANGLTETFNLAVDNNPQPAPNLGNARLMVSGASAVPGEAVGLTGSNFPASTAVQIGIGPVASESQIIASTQTGADGRFSTQVSVPASATPGQQYVFVAEVNNAIVTASPITITGAGQPGEGVNQPVNGLISRTYMYLVALEDAGQSGPLIGCNDSAVPVIIDIEPTNTPMTAAINRLLSLNEQYYGQSGLYNALYQSNLALQGINITEREAVINLTGELIVSGVCDEPRVLAQLERTALQYDTIDNVTILLNGQTLPSQLSGRG